MTRWNALIAVVEGDFLVFETTHLNQYAILGSNTPFETSEQPTDPTDPTDPTTPTDPTDPAGPTDPTTPTDPADPADPTDPAKPEQQGKPSEQIESPQTGDKQQYDAVDWSNVGPPAAVVYRYGGFTAKEKNCMLNNR